MIAAAKTNHLQERQQQRGLRDDVLEFILDYGQVQRDSAVRWYHVQRRSLPSYLRNSELAERASHWVVIVDKDNPTAITAYAVRNPSRHIRQKCVAGRKKHRQIPYVPGSRHLWNCRK